MIRFDYEETFIVFVVIHASMNQKIKKESFDPALVNNE